LPVHPEGRRLVTTAFRPADSGFSAPTACGLCGSSAGLLAEIPGKRVSAKSPPTNSRSVSDHATTAASNHVELPRGCAVEGCCIRRRGG
jgi:hypothetical protein